MNLLHLGAGLGRRWRRRLLRPVLAALLLTAAAPGWRNQAHAAEANQVCAPSAHFQFVCGLSNPEDIVPLPSTRWMIVSGNKKGGGLSAVDARSGRVIHLSTARANPDAKTYPGCAAPKETLFTHGVYALPTGKGRYKLYVVGHEPEMIHVFDMALKSSGPSLTWIGCVATPPGASNAVAAMKDGTMLMTIFTFPGLSMGDMEVGTLTGAVYRWRPGDKAFAELPGTRLIGNNGIELSADEKTMFVVASGARAVSAFTVADQPQLLWTTPTPIAKPDNIRREPGGTYMIGGMVDDEKACGGKRRLINGQLEVTSCHRGSVAVRLDPATREAKVVAHVEQDADFTGVASAVEVGGRIWFGSFNGDRIASIPVSGASH